MWKLHAPAYGLTGAPSAFCRALRRCLLGSANSLDRAGLEFPGSSSGPGAFFIFRNLGGAVGAIATHIADIPGRGEPDVLPRARNFSERRLGDSKVREKSCACPWVWMCHRRTIFRASWAGRSLRRGCDPLACRRIYGLFANACCNLRR